MRIVRLANFVAPHSGGLRTSLAELGAGYLAAGHEPVLVIPGERDGDELTAQGRVITLRAPRVPFTGGYRVLWRRRRLARLLADLRPDALEVSDRTTLRWTGAWAREHGVPAVMVSHESVTALLKLTLLKLTLLKLTRLGLDRAVADWLNRRTARAYHRVICTTGWAAAEFGRIDAGNLVRVPLGVDLDTFSPGSGQIRTRYVGEGQILLVHCGRLSAEKKPQRSLTTLATLRAAGMPVRLVVAGDGPLRARLVRRAARAGLPVTFAGFLPGRAELAALLASADVAIAPGPAETFGLEPVNLNVLSKPSGNLQLHECVPSARLKVRNRLSKRNERTKPHDGSKLRTTPMSQNYDPNSYPGGYGWPGYASAPPPPPRRRNHKRGLIVTGAVALAAGAAAGGLIGSSHGLTASTMTAASRTPLSASQIAQRVDPSLVDVVSTLGDQGASAAGTGIVLTSDGTVLTNNHVIRGATSIKVTDVGNGRTYTAKVVGYDATRDVAVIQLQNASGLTTANLGDSSSVRSGDSVTALGNAGGKGGTPSVATGAVTALNQGITASDEGSGTNSEQLTGLIETNADIQPGDSGGALVNSYGQVIGMNTAASSGTQFQSQSDQAAVQAYAIPVDNAETIAKQVEAGQGSSTVHIGATAFLGIESDGSSSGSGSGSGSGDSGGFGGQGDGSGFGGFGGQGDGSGFGGFGSQGDGSGTNGSGTNGSGTNGSGTSSGVTIAGALAGSPAASAGLTAGDTITSVGGQAVSSPSDIEQTLVKYHPGDKISVNWLDQSGQSQTTTVTLASGPAA